MSSVASIDMYISLQIGSHDMRYDGHLPGYAGHKQSGIGGKDEGRLNAEDNNDKQKSRARDTRTSLYEGGNHLFNVMLALCHHSPRSLPQRPQVRSLGKSCLP